MDLQRVIRFRDHSGRTLYGNVPEHIAVQPGVEVQVLQGDLYSGFTPTADTRNVAELLCPLAETPIFLCIGANYRAHAREANYQVPSQPVLFTKPADALAGPLEDIHVPPSATQKLDYEGELCFVIGKDCKDINPNDALEYILGYTVGNDLSARHLISSEVSGSQMSYGKSFDRFAPVGPCIVAASILGDSPRLQISTKVNGQTRQNSNTADMIWGIGDIVAHITKGRTVRKGTVVMTGTPSGVGWFMQPPGYINSGDIVEVTIENIGTIRNRFIF